MTALLTVCPYCKSNMMLLHTETGSGECIVCKRSKTFGPDEISEAETRRDRLFDKYEKSMQIAFENGDSETMSKIALEVVGEGVSSWYAWFCIGWSHLHKGMTSAAFEDFRLAVAFLEEEDFDEFYDLVSDATLESLKGCVLEEKDWSDEGTALCAFTGTLSERFGYLMDCDFICGLMDRTEEIRGEMTRCTQCMRMLREIMLLATDYMAGNTFIPDHILLMDAAASAMEAVDRDMVRFQKDGTVPQPISKTWGEECPAFLRLFSEAESGRISGYSHEQLEDLSDYWIKSGDFESLFDKYQDALEHQFAFMRSLGRNKGILKKRDKAIDEYCSAIVRPLEEGLIDVDDGEEDGDIECPQCGAKLVPGEDGRILCDCGFKSRLATDRYDTLPTDPQDLKEIGLKAFDERDAGLLNDVGEKTVDLFPEDPFGQFALGCSCVLDGEVGESMMLFAESAKLVGDIEKDDYYGRIVEMLHIAMASASADQVPAAIAMLPLSKEMTRLDGMFSRDILSRIRSIEVTSADHAVFLVMMVDSLLDSEVLSEHDIRRQADICKASLGTLSVIDGGASRFKKDSEAVRVSISTMMDLLGCFVSETEKALSTMSDEEVASIVTRRGSDGFLAEKADDLLDALSYDGDAVFNPKSKGMSKAKSSIKRYVKEYLSRGHS